MNQRFSSQLLRSLRNNVPIHDLIYNTLRLESRFSDGIYRFLCPCCASFQTAINPKTNLARCFFCQMNFNPIDLTMIVKHYSFVESVNFLSPFLPK